MEKQEPHRIEPMSICQRHKIGKLEADLKFAERDVTVVRQAWRDTYARNEKLRGDLLISIIAMIIVTIALVIKLFMG